MNKALKGVAVGVLMVAVAAMLVLAIYANGPTEDDADEMLTPGPAAMQDGF